MEIRPINKGDDRMELSGVYEESWKYAYQGIIPQAYLESIPRGRWAAHAEQAGMHTLVALSEGKIVGTASYCSARFPEMQGLGEIVSIYFLPAYMGKGGGGALLAAALDGLEALGFKEVFLWVLEDNHRARRFYERQGFWCSEVYLQDNIGGKALREVQYHRSVKVGGGEA